MWIRPRGEDVEIDVWVVPNASGTSIEGVHGEALRVRVSSPPERGRATAAVAAVLAAALGVRVNLLRGASSRRKTFVARGIEAADAISRLGSDR